MAAAPPTHRPAARRALRHYVLAAFRLLQADVDAGQEVPFALDEGSRGAGPSLYNWRPLFGSYVAERADALAALPDGRAALDTLRTEPALTAFARERQPALTDLDTALRDTVLLPLLVATADACGGFDLDDAALERLLLRLERAAVAERTTYAALAPLVGVEAAPDGAELGLGVVLQRVSASGLAADWPESQGLLPEGFLREPDRRHVLVVSAAVPRGEDAALPDAAGAIACVVTALRLVLGGCVAAGPAAFERVDWSPRAVLPLPPAAAVAPPGDAVRIDGHAVTLVRALAPRIAAAGEGAAPLAVALGRYGAARSGLSPAERVAGLHDALEPLLAEDGAGSWAVAMRAAALVGQSAAERQRLVSTLRQASRVTRGTTWPSALGEEERLEHVLDGVVPDRARGRAGVGRQPAGLRRAARRRAARGPPATAGGRRRGPHRVARSAGRQTPSTTRRSADAAACTRAASASSVVPLGPPVTRFARASPAAERTAASARATAAAASGRRSGTHRSAVSAPSTATSAAALARSTSSSADVVIVAVNDPLPRAPPARVWASAARAAR